MKIIKFQVSRDLFDIWLQTNGVYHVTNFCRLCLDYIRNSVSIRQFPWSNSYAIQILHWRKAFCMLHLEWYLMFHSTAPLHIFLQTYNQNRNRIFHIDQYPNNMWFRMENFFIFLVMTYMKIMSLAPWPFNIDPILQLHCSQHFCLSSTAPNNVVKPLIIPSFLISFLSFSALTSSVL